LHQDQTLQQTQWSSNYNCKQLEQQQQNTETERLRGWQQ